MSVLREEGEDGAMAKEREMVCILHEQKVRREAKYIHVREEGSGESHLE